MLILYYYRFPVFTNNCLGQIYLGLAKSSFWPSVRNLVVLKRRLMQGAVNDLYSHSNYPTSVDTMIFRYNFIDN
jgi:hypothetical protein